MALGGAPELEGRARELREAFQRRTGAFQPEDPWFEARTRAFWDDAVTTGGFAALAATRLDGTARVVAARLARAHRGLFVTLEVDARGALLSDLWSGAELLVRHLDEAQALALEHAEGPVDARVVAANERELVVLPGALHHPADALEPTRRVLDAARERGMTTPDALDALLRMERVLRASSRVRAAFAYRPEGLSRA